MTFSRTVAAFSENTLVHISRKPQNRRLLLACHGHGGQAFQFTQGPLDSIGEVVSGLTDAGYTMASLDAGGTVAWGSDSATDRVEDNRKLFMGELGNVGDLAYSVDAGKKTVIIGWSMGGITAQNYARRFPSKVAGLLLFVPVYDLEAVRTAHPSDWAGEIDAVYSTLAIRQAHDPKLFAPANLAGLKTYLYGSADDAVLPPATHFRALKNGRPNDVELHESPTGGHAAFWGNLDIDGIVAWLNSLSWT